MERIKLNISGNLVSVTIPATETFLEAKQQLKKVIMKNHNLLKTLRFYRIDNNSFLEKELLELEKDIESMVKLRSINNFSVGEKNKKVKDKFKLHYGNLRSGEKIVTDSNLIILGNLNPGSYVKSKKNIFILGKVRGTVFAGSDINKYQSSFIYIEKTDKLQVRIGNEHIVYENQKKSENIIFEKSNKKIVAKQIEKIEIQNLLKKMGIHLI